ncbi:hypothetical protein EVAR_98035_1 [Eumeta japonica]|uniref:Uncharacterized protein n=1 Tax=Eumeta variegata TaxID=151549 RepID=A0A4C1ZVA5_EUMVA|nr:hypothetical protein EVAR_98035_1 [Eumeta japonica]
MYSVTWLSSAALKYLTDGRHVTRAHVEHADGPVRTGHGNSQNCRIKRSKPYRLPSVRVSGACYKISGGVSIAKKNFTVLQLFRSVAHRRRLPALPDSTTHTIGRKVFTIKCVCIHYQRVDDVGAPSAAGVRRRSSRRRARAAARSVGTTAARLVSAVAM